ncbi:MAG: RagB/SusD family nutrient uptake outer membrane protein [Alistipes sp.]
MKKIILFLSLPLLLTACDLDHYPSDSMTSDQLDENPASAKYSTDGNYSMFKDVLAYKGTEYSGNTYVRHYFQMTEFRGDNVSLAHKTEDPLYNEMCYSDLITDQPNSYVWWAGYHIIYAANSIIKSLPEGASGEYDHMLGENYFMRAICHLHLVTLYAKPYSYGRENMGVILRTSTITDVTVRASVGAVYDQIRDDLIKAAALMKADEGRVTNHGYISRDAALGLLSRVYLYRGENDKVIETVNEMLGGEVDGSSKLDPDCAHYFANALNSPETLWAIAHVATIENRGRESIGSMYYTADSKGVSGWAEMYYSDPLLKLFQRHPEDLRYTGYCIPLEPVEGKMQVRWAVAQAGDSFRLNEIRDVELDDATKNYFFMNDGSKIFVTPEKSGKYTKYFIQWNGAKTEVYLDQKIFCFNTCPAFMCAKFTGQDGEPMLSSPVMIRWGEVILNRAEAYAKMGGNDQKALDDVNAIRKRAGLTNALYTLSNYQEEGYKNVLEVVLDERRLELCYEGHRAFDVYRNKLSMDRKFSGAQAWEVIPYTDNRIQYRIPFDETSVSGIPQND